MSLAVGDRAAALGALRRVREISPYFSPTDGPTVLDAAGGAVRGADGSIVSVAPGSLDASTTVSIAPIAVAALPLAAPAGWSLDAWPRRSGLPDDPGQLFAEPTASRVRALTRLEQATIYERIVRPSNLYLTAQASVD